MPSDGVLSEPVLITAGIQGAASMVRAILLLMLLPASLSFSLSTPDFPKGHPAEKTTGQQKCAKTALSLSLWLKPHHPLSLSQRRRSDTTSSNRSSIPHIQNTKSVIWLFFTTCQTVLPNLNIYVSTFTLKYEFVYQFKIIQIFHSNLLLHSAKSEGLYS